MHQVIATGSTGNAVIYHGSILVDCGVPFAAIEPFMYQLQIVLLTHKHGDHINPATLAKLAQNRPTLRIACGEWMLDQVKGLNNVDRLENGELYDYGSFQVCPVKLYHDVPNCGYRIFKDGSRIFHATDTAHLLGITAKNYDLYAIEHNYDAETIDAVIEAKRDRDEFSYEMGATESHLSQQQARHFIYENAGPNAETLRLHESTPRA